MFIIYWSKYAILIFYNTIYIFVTARNFSLDIVIAGIKFCNTMIHNDIVQSRDTWLL